MKPFSFDNPKSRHFKEIKEMEEKKIMRRRREEEKQKQKEEELKKKEEKEMKAMIKVQPDIIPIATRALKKKIEKQFEDKEIQKKKEKIELLKEKRKEKKLKEIKEKKKASFNLLNELDELLMQKDDSEEVGKVYDEKLKQLFSEEVTNRVNYFNKMEKKNVLIKSIYIYISCYFKYRNKEKIWMQNIFLQKYISFYIM